MRSPPNPERCGTVRPLAGEALLETWECGSVQSQPGRAITLLMAGYPHLSPADAAAVTLPARDLALLDLRRRSFGATLALFAECASCGERLEFTLPADTAEAALERAAGAESALLHEGCSLRLRLADTCDIAAAAAEPDLDAARTLLLDRCLDATDADGNAIPLEKLPEAARDVALAELAALHEPADLSVSLLCPACEKRQALAVDLPAFLWAEVRHAARRLVDEVHELAWAYGWSEQAILAMNPRRRQVYLERVRA